MKLTDETLDEQQLRQLKISCLKMINGLLAFTYMAITVWVFVQAIEMIIG
jgi:hypothetical protein